jgi:ABC-type transport system involved in cytochrome bd biosynthesis fused ATPase/permease subunit
MVADIDQLQDVALRLLLPVGVAVVASAAVVGGVLVVSPSAGVVRGAGLAVGAFLGPLVAARVVARYQRRQAALRARLTADLVDALDAADELWLNGADGRAAAAGAADDQALVQVALRDAAGAGAADAIGVAAAALTTLAVLATTTRVAPGG